MYGWRSDNFGSVWRFELPVVFLIVDVAVDAMDPECSRLFAVVIGVGNDVANCVILPLALPLTLLITLSIALHVWMTERYVGSFE